MQIAGYQLTIITKKSREGSVNAYLFVTHVSQDRRHFVFVLYREASVFAAVMRVSYAFTSRSRSQANRAHGDIIKLKSWVVLREAFWCRLTVHHLQAYCNCSGWGVCGNPENGERGKRSGCLRCLSSRRYMQPGKNPDVQKSRSL
jgi:hypothetical protein